ncbi:MAG: NAD(+) diphosphatase [bacterium]|nr:NAD(+) diphosphatase [bacterium]
MSNTNENALWFLFRRDELLMITNPGETDFRVPSMLPGSPEQWFKPGTRYDLGETDGRPYFCAEAADDIQVPEGMAFFKLLHLYRKVNFELIQVAGYAGHISYWDQNTRFCGHCSAPTKRSETERAKICPKCKLTMYPRISPSMITAVVKGNEILLASSKRFKSGMYSVLAGFVEPGENLEDCVRREVMEETGIEVKNIKYFGSQPWPFPDSLMVGFTAEYESGEIRIDDDEIEDAGWFTAESMPCTPTTFSISGQLIKWFAENHS